MYVGCFKKKKRFLVGVELEVLNVYGLYGSV